MCYRLDYLFVASAFLYTAHAFLTDKQHPTKVISHDAYSMYRFQQRRNTHAFILTRRVYRNLPWTSIVSSLASSSDSTPYVDTTASRSFSSDTQFADAQPNEPTKSVLLDMPWSDIQAWALKDNMAKYTIQVPIVRGTKETIQVYTLWRTLADDVFELSGYPLPFLVERYTEMRDSNQTVLKTSPGILPFLDNYEFVATGGLAGQVFGVAGVEDGTWIQTTPVDNVHATISKGFVRTADGSAIYELGRPAKPEELKSSPDGWIKQAQDNAVTAASSIRISDSRDLNYKNNENRLVIDSDLVNLGGLTALVVAGAAAFESLSHHLTVNVFWV